MTRVYSAFLMGVFFLILCACPGAPPPQEVSIPLSGDTPIPETTTVKAAGLREAVAESGGVISESLDQGASVAIISITAADSFEGEYALEELTMLLVMTHKFRVVDRQNLDIIRAEQQFQLSGDVDDGTAVSIGHLIGAAYVITGSISQGESEKILRLRVLDVQTGQIRSMSSTAY